MNLLPYIGKLTDRDKRLITHILYAIGNYKTNQYYRNDGLPDMFPFLNHETVVSMLLYYYKIDSSTVALDARVQNILAKLGCEVKLKVKLK